MDSRFNVGDTVKISSTSKYYIGSDGNPINVNGYVYQVENPKHNEDHNIDVRWDTKISNCYREVDLKLVKRREM